MHQRKLNPSAICTNYCVPFLSRVLDKYRVQFCIAGNLRHFPAMIYYCYNLAWMEPLEAITHHLYKHILS